MSDWKEYLDMEVEKIYFDMDNTIADFHRGLKELCGLSPIPQELATPEQDDAMWAAIRKTDHFYYKLKKCPFGMQLLEKYRLLLGDKVEILTAVPKAKRGIETAEEDKLRWVKKHIGEDIVVNIVHSAEEKQAFAGPGCFLIDDLANNIAQWENAGGIGIHYQDDDSQAVEDALANTALACTLYIYPILTCPDCEADVDKRQKFCEICGADIRAKGGPTVDYREMMCIYGPPPDIAKITCPNCKTSWTAYRDSQSDSAKRFCKKCGTCIEHPEFKDYFSK